jgi:hypothetical protein
LEEPASKAQPEEPTEDSQKEITPAAPPKEEAPEVPTEDLPKEAPPEVLPKKDEPPEAPAKEVLPQVSPEAAPEMPPKPDESPEVPARDLSKEAPPETPPKKEELVEDTAKEMPLEMPPKPDKPSELPAEDLAKEAPPEAPPKKEEPVEAPAKEIPPEMPPKVEKPPEVLAEDLPKEAPPEAPPKEKEELAEAPAKEAPPDAPVEDLPDSNWVPLKAAPQAPQKEELPPEMPPTAVPNDAPEPPMKEVAFERERPKKVALGTPIADPVEEAAEEKPDEKRDKKREKKPKVELKYYTVGKTPEQKTLEEARRLCRLSYHRVTSAPPCYRDHLPSTRPAMEQDLDAWNHVLERKLDFDAKQAIYHKMHYERELKEERLQKQRSVYRGEPTPAKSLPKSFEATTPQQIFSWKPSMNAKLIAAEIMKTCDTMVHNGELTLQELQNELGHGSFTTSSIRFGEFYTWLMSPQTGATKTLRANWKKFDANRDGSISLGELEYAVSEWLGEYGGSRRGSKKLKRPSTGDDASAVPAAPAFASPQPPAEMSAAGSGLAAVRSAASLAIEDDKTNRLSRGGTPDKDANRTINPRSRPISRSTPELPQIKPYSSKSGLAQQFHETSKGRRRRPGMDLRKSTGVDLLKTLRDGIAPSAICAPIGRS